MKFLNYEILLNPVWLWVVAMAVAVVVFVAMSFLKRVGLKHLSRLAAKTKTGVDDFVVGVIDQKTTKAFKIIFSAWAGLYLLQLPRKVSEIIDGVAIIAAFVLLALCVNEGIKRWFSLRIEQKQIEDPESSTTLLAMSFISRLGLWTVVVLAGLSNLGVNISTLVASMGIGGVAIALASQTILADLFSSFAITIDKPFRVGDYIVVDGYMGTVETIGLKTTSIRSLGGEQIVFSNNDLLKSRIRNYKRMAHRRVVFSIGVTYQTPFEKLQKIPKMVEDIITDVGLARFDRCHFFSYGDSSLDFEIVYHVQDRDYNLFMDIQQEINLKLFEKFETEGIEFAFPTRVTYQIRLPDETPDDTDNPAQRPQDIEGQGDKVDRGGKGGAT